MGRYSILYQKVFRKDLYTKQWEILKANGIDSIFWLFSGNKGVGKCAFAEKWIRYHVRCHDIHCHPNVCVIQSEEEITVDGIQKVRTFLSKKNEEPRFVLIDNADKMNRFAQNALLKTFEGDYERTSIILIVHNISAVLPTILSRFQKLPFVLDEEDIPDNLKLLIPYAGLNMYYLEILSKWGGIDWIEGVKNMWSKNVTSEEWVKKHAEHALNVV